MKFTPAVAIVAAAFLLSCMTPVSTQGLTDAQITDTVVRSVNTYSRFTVFDHVTADVQNGIVRLTGRVTMPFKRDDIGRRVASLDGVRSVRNDIGVLPPSPYDDELRHKVARAIYGHAAFWRYAAMSNPPIHIVVEGGHVTLTGVVQSDVDRTLARSLATGLGEVSLTSALRTDVEAR